MMNLVSTHCWRGWTKHTLVVGKAGTAVVKGWQPA